MIKRIAVGFGVVFILVGIMGFIPGLTPMDSAGHGRLLGIFAVDPVHNAVHILSGALALAAGFASEAASRMFFRALGVIYALVALLGLFTGRGELLGIMANNGADVVLHLAIAVVALFLGFGHRFGGAGPGRHHPA